MTEHPDFFNPRKMAIAFVVGPSLLLLLIVVLEEGWKKLSPTQEQVACAEMVSAPSSHQGQCTQQRSPKSVP